MKLALKNAVNSIYNVKLIIVTKVCNYKVIYFTAADNKI